MGKEELEEIKQTKRKIDRLYTISENINGQIKNLLEKKKFLEMLP